MKIWQADNTAKILQDRQYTERCASSVFLKLYQNETEGVQLVLTPDRDIAAYDVCVSALTCGKHTIPTSALTVYAVKYIEVKRPSDGTEPNLGWYPDALLPFSVSKQYGENHIAAHKNQSVWINVKTDSKTPSGVYTGTIRVRLDEEVYTLPFSVTVWDFALPTENHSKQLFIISNKEMQRGEGEKSLPLLKRYYDKALEYRINGSNLPYNHRIDDFDGALKDYLQTLKHYHFDERCSMFNIPHTSNATEDGVDYGRVEKILDGIASMSEADGENYCKKLVAYIWILDEPHHSPQRMEYCRKVLPKFEAFKRRLAEKYKATLPRMGEMLAQTLCKLPVIMTCGALAELLPNSEKEYYITFCPSFASYTQDDTREVLQALNKGEKWWYGCDWPAPPNPTYHIDDTLLSARLLSWMQFSYNITGNLYWRFNYCKRMQDGKEIPPDPYNVANPNTSTNGDGFLVYPGKPYGLDCFVPSIRLEAIRDGIEEYEALYSLRALWKKTSQEQGLTTADVNHVLLPIYSRMFDKARLLKEPLLDFQSARELLANLLIASSKHSFFVIEREENAKKITFYAKNVESVGGGVCQCSDHTYTVYVEKESVVIRFTDGTIVTLYVQTIVQPTNYTFDFNWKATAEKYGITDASGEDIMQPYRTILQTAGENIYPACKSHDRLSRFVWKTEAVIRKYREKAGVKVVITLPRGKLTSTVAYTETKLDETATEYVFHTTEKRLSVNVENEKGEFFTDLYL